MRVFRLRLRARRCVRCRRSYRRGRIRWCRRDQLIDELFGDEPREAARNLADLPAEPVLTPPGDDGVLSAVDPEGLLVVGLSARWRDEGIGAVRTRIAERSPAPVVFVRRGVRPGGLAPAEELTRFTWSLAEA